MRSLAVSAVLILSMLSGCGGESASSDTIRVGTLPFAGSVPLAYALEQGYFEEAAGCADTPGLQADLGIGGDRQVAW